LAQRGLALASLWLAVLATACASALLLPASAPAEEPFRVEAQVTDRVGALDARGSEVDAALDELQRREGAQLWVVYVDSFSGAPAQDWADETALESDLGLNDALLAVATGDRAYAYSVDQQFPLSDDELAEVMTVAVEPALAENDWAGAAVGAAQGMGQALRGEQVTPPQVTPGEAAPGGGTGLGWIFALLGLALLAAVAVFVVRARRRGAGRRAVGPPSGAPEAATGPYSGLSLEELRERANRQLVETDDAIRTSEQELGFAVASFGEEQTRSFAEALRQAHAELAEAFRLRRELEDLPDADEDARRGALLEILRRTDAASDRLDEEAERFDRLRDLERHAPQVLAGLARSIADLESRLGPAERTLAALGETYSAAALNAVDTNVAEARERLTFAGAQASVGQTALDEQRGGEAVLAARAAEEATGQAGQLLRAIERLKEDLEKAGERIESAIADTRQDIEAARAVQGDGRLQAALQAATAAVGDAEVAAAPEGGRDPLAALERLERADTALERALRGVREAEEHRRRTLASLDQALLAARAQAAAAGDFITTRRGAVGSEARMQLAEAERHLERALALRDGNPAAALSEATTADGLAAEALRLARSDATRTMEAPFPGMGGMGGGMGGMGGLGGAILGGILVSSMLGGRGGGFGGGGFGGRRGGGGFFGPASFGGRGTRMRRGGGGRF
jgi:uncharacterized membrane protein YgcG